MSLTTYLPKYEDLWFKQQMLADEETMSYNHAYGGCIDFSKDCWDNWYQKWIINTDNQRYYRYLKDDNNNFVGEIAYHYDEEIKGYLIDVLIYAKFRHQGYGTEGLKLLCDAAKTNHITKVYDIIAGDNEKQALGIFLKNGFKILHQTKDTIMIEKDL